MTNPIRSLARLAVLSAVAVLSACSAAGGSAVPSSDPSLTISPLPVETAPAGGTVTTPEAAVAAVIAAEPRFTGIQPLDPNLIGQSAWYEVTPASGVGAFLVEITVGWGDCQAGCIDKHMWTYAVAPDGTVTLQEESGDAVPADAYPNAPDAY